MRRKKWIIGVTMIFILIIYFVMSRPQDDMTLMKKLISKDIKTNQTIILYNATHVHNHRLVSYILSSKNKYQGVGYAHFKINNKSKYELLNIIQPDRITEKASDINIYEFYNLKREFSKFIDDEVSINVPINTSLFVISNNPNLSRIDRIMDNGQTQVKEIDDSPDISFFDDLNSKNKVEYKLYNKNGDIIK